MKLQRHYILLLFILPFLVLWLIPMQSAVAQQEKSDKTEKKGLIIFDFPVSLEAKVEVNLTAKTHQSGYQIGEQYTRRCRTNSDAGRYLCPHLR